jgi:cobalt-zinc-cadmium efflux system outer membrane protein
MKIAKQRIFKALMISMVASSHWGGTASLAADQQQPVQPQADQQQPLTPVTPEKSELLKASVIHSPAPSKNFSLSTCFAMADRSNREIIVARRNLKIARAGITIAGAIPNPIFQLQTGFGDTFTQLYTGQTQQAVWTEDFQTAGKRSKKINLAKATYFVQLAQLGALQFNVHNRVRRAYAELAAAEAYALLVETERDTGTRLLTVAKKRYEAGKSPYSEVLQADLNVLQFDTQRNSAQGRLQQASSAMSLIIGDNPERIEVFDPDDIGLFRLSAQKTEIVPSPSKLLPALDALVNIAVNSRPDYLAALQTIEQNRKALTLARAQRFPDLFVSSGFTFAGFSRHQPPGLVAQPNWLGNGVLINVSAENPILYQHQGEIHQAAATLRLSERQADLLRAQISTDTVTAYNNAEVARENVLKYEQDLLPTAAEVARVARRGYEAGATDLGTAIIAQQQYQQTLSSYFDTVVAYQVAWADLEQAMGVPLNL